MKKKYSFIITLLLVFLQGIAQNTEESVLLKDSIETTNKAKLATDVYLPDTNNTYPTLLIRTPYKKDNIKDYAIAFNKKGYAVVVQDCRGKYGSSGDFYAFADERIDGLKTIEWIKKQSWYNGKIAGYGGSYLGYTQWAISDQLDAICAEMTGANVYDLLYPQGLFSLSTSFNWGLIMNGKTGSPISAEKIQESYSYLPLSIADDSTYHYNRYVSDWLLHEKNDSYWQNMDHRSIAKGPLLSIGGWYDIFLLTQLNDFVAVDNKNNHPENRLIIGPWCHGRQAYENSYGGQDKTGDRGALQERFLAKNILGKNIEVIESPFTDSKYNLFIMERNEYFGSEVWPPKEVSTVDYFLDKNKITKEIPKKSNQLEFTYNPLDPYPNLGGTFLGGDVGPAIQNKNNDRTDQWVFESDILTDPLILLGSVSASLYVNSTSNETDFMILIQDVFPNDTIINIQEGGKHVKIDNKEINKIELESWPTGYQLNPGHKLRVVITSSWFPRYNRSLNTDEAIHDAKESKNAIQRIYLGPEHPSKITLPLLEIN